MTSSPTAPINLLPTDILIETFHFFLFPSSSLSPTQTTVLHQICRHWRDIFLSTPQFHATFSFPCNQTRIDGFRAHILGLLERSKGYPLDVTFTGEFPLMPSVSMMGDDNPSQTELLAADVVRRSAKRLRRVRICTDGRAYIKLRVLLSRELPMLSRLEVDLRRRELSWIPINFDPILAPDLTSLRLSIMDRTMYDLGNLPWTSLRTFEAPVGLPDHVFRVLSWAPQLRRASFRLGSFTPLPSSDSEWNTPDTMMITHTNLQILAITWLDPSPSSTESLTLLFSRLTLPSLTSLSIHAHNPLFLSPTSTASTSSSTPTSTLPSFLHRSTQNLQKLELKFTENTAERGLSRILVETPDLKVLVLDELLESEIDLLMPVGRGGFDGDGDVEGQGQGVGLVTQLEVLEVEKADDRPRILKKVHELIWRRMMVSVAVDVAVDAGGSGARDGLTRTWKLNGKLSKFTFKNGYSENLLLGLVLKSPRWSSAMKAMKWTEMLNVALDFDVGVEVKGDESSDMSEGDQLRARDTLLQIQANKDSITALDLFFSRLPVSIKHISSLSLTAFPGTKDTYNLISLAQMVLKDICEPKVEEFTRALSRGGVVGMLAARRRGHSIRNIRNGDGDGEDGEDQKDEVRYYRIPEHEQEIWYSKFMSDAWAVEPEEVPIPSVVEAFEGWNVGR